MGNRQPENTPAKEEVGTSAVVLSLQAPDSNDQDCCVIWELRSINYLYSSDLPDNAFVLKIGAICRKQDTI